MSLSNLLTDQPFTRADRAALRHPWERTIFFLSAAASLGIVALLLAVISEKFIAPSLWNSIAPEERMSYVAFLLGVVVLPAGILMARRTKVAKDRSSGVTVSDVQLPYVRELLRYYCQQAGVRDIPAVVVTAGAKPSSYTSPSWRRHTITLSNMLVEVKDAEGDRVALRYALAREVGHIAAGHRTVLRTMLTLVMKAVPYASGMLSRAEAYTADRWAAVLAPDCARTYFGVEATGKFLWLELDMEDMAARAGAGGVLETMNAYLVPLPPITWRVQAIAALGVFQLLIDADIAARLRAGERLATDALPLRAHHGALWVPPKTAKDKRD